MIFIIRSCKGEGLEKIKSMDKIKIESGIKNETVIKIDERVRMN